MTALGRSGVLRDRNGLPIVDPSPGMRPVKARGLYDDHGEYHRMWMSDPIVFGGVGFFIREITRASYDVWTPPSPTPAEGYAAELLAKYTGLDGTCAFLVGGLRRLLYHLSLGNWYGFALLEIIDEVKTFRGRPVWIPAKLRNRAQWSIERWLWQGEDLVGAQQVIQDDTPEFPDYGAASSLAPAGVSMRKRRAVIPADRFLLFSHNAIDGNPEGVSDLRPVWKYAELKRNTLSRIESAEELLWAGEYVIRELLNPDGSTAGQISADDIAYTANLLEQRILGFIRYFVEPAGIRVDASHPDYEVNDRSNYLEWINAQERAAMGQAFLGLQAGTGGISEGFQNALYAAAADKAEAILDVINGQPGVPYTGLVERLIRRNVPEASDERFRFPRLTVSGIEHRNPKAWTDNSTKLAQFRITTPTVRDEVWARKINGWPTLSEAEIQEARDKAEQQRLSEKGTQSPQAPQAGADAGDMSERPGAGNSNGKYEGD